MELQRWHSRPPETLTGLIDRVWGWEGRALSLPVLAAGTGVDLFFHYGAPPSIGGVLTPRAHLLAFREHTAELEPSGELGFVAVRFRTGRLRRFCSTGWNELSDHVTPIEALWGHEGHDLALRVVGASSRDEREALLVEFFSERLDRLEQTRERELELLIDRLYYAPQTRIGRLAQDLGWSTRQLERAFFGAFGVTAKRFARCARLQRALRTLALDPEAQPLRSALEAGYYDQSHFYYDLRSLMRRAPAALIDRLRCGVHFYLPSAREVAPER